MAAAIEPQAVRAESMQTQTEQSLGTVQLTQHAAPPTWSATSCTGSSWHGDLSDSI